ncbi:hypothetical protein OUZ56_010065 [Daphnia magna]|uniref:Uncharacterized protein n=1 Tax=Daphnia magna TaxID=35525 RepID=A0ABR0AI37_9CRUS|nr:hypothetical protein OUZ56_010065 [Daphnia magna]
MDDLRSVRSALSVKITYPIAKKATRSARGRFEAGLEQGRRSKKMTCPARPVVSSSDSTITTFIFGKLLFLQAASPD